MCVSVCVCVCVCSVVGMRVTTNATQSQDSILHMPIHSSIHLCAGIQWSTCMDTVVAKLILYTHTHKATSLYTPVVLINLYLNEVWNTLRH